MFLILLSNVFYGFWGNKVGDIFIDNTITNLHLDEKKVKVVHFSQIWNVPEFYEVSGNNLIIKNQIITRSLQAKENKTDPDVYLDVITYETIANHEGVIYYENGTKILEC